MRFHGHRDMLHDTDRNEAYARAIAEAVRRIRNSSDSEPYAVDIGAGSGLLGLIAARAGAAVTAFEVVPALALNRGLNYKCTGWSCTRHSRVFKKQN